MLHELTAGEAGLLALLLPHLAGMELRQVEDLGGGVRIVARTRTASLGCRGCGVVSAQVHDRYRRRLQDLACAGRPAGRAGGLPVLLRQPAVPGGDVR